MAITLDLCLEKAPSRQVLLRALAQALLVKEREIMVTDKTWALPGVSDEILVIGETSFIRNFSFPWRITLYLRHPRLHEFDELEVEQNVCTTLHCRGIVPDNRPEQVLRPTAWLLLDGTTVEETYVSYEDLDQIDESQPYALP